MDVVCLCAAWCGACRAYQPVFNAVTRTKPEWRTHWVDIEEVETDVEGVDITTFPMVLIANMDGTVCFAGPVSPQPGTLERLCEAAREGSLRMSDEEVATWQTWFQTLRNRNV
jgi:hypothetical protein